MLEQIVFHFDDGRDMVITHADETPRLTVGARPHDRMVRRGGLASIDGSDPRAASARHP